MTIADYNRSVAAARRAYTLAPTAERAAARRLLEAARLELRLARDCGRVVTVRVIEEVQHGA